MADNERSRGAGGSRDRDARSGGARSGNPKAGNPKAGNRGPRGSGSSGPHAGRDTSRGRDERPARTGPPAPVIDDDVTGRELDKAVRNELSTLDGPVAGTIARHLVMAGRLIDENPEGAHRHTQHARRLAGRVAIVREAAGHAAYEAGHYDIALKEFQTARRISGRAAFLAVMADCERGVGRPEKAIALLDDPEASRLPPEDRAELAIVVSGAMRDIGRAGEALALLTRVAPAQAPGEQWVARLQYALGDLLAEAGRTDDAVTAFATAEANDVEGSLDAGDRVVDLMST